MLSSIVDTAPVCVVVRRLVLVGLRRLRSAASFSASASSRRARIRLAAFDQLEMARRRRGAHVNLPVRFALHDLDQPFAHQLENRR